MPLIPPTPFVSLLHQFKWWRVLFTFLITVTGHLVDSGGSADWTKSYVNVYFAMSTAMLRISKVSGPIAVIHMVLAEHGWQSSPWEFMSVFEWLTNVCRLETVASASQMLFQPELVGLRRLANHTLGYTRFLVAWLAVAESHWISFLVLFVSVPFFSSFPHP